MNKDKKEAFDKKLKELLKKRYVILSDRKIEDLEDKVSILINNGYYLAGGVQLRITDVVHIDAERTLSLPIYEYLQSMYKS